MLLARTLAKSAAPPDECDEWDQPQEDEFKNFRMEGLYDAMLDVCEMLGGINCLQGALEDLRVHVPACAADSDRWRQVEGCLFFVRATARYIPEDDTSVVPPILVLGPQVRYIGVEG